MKDKHLPFDEDSLGDMKTNLQASFPTMIKANQYFDPATCPFEVLGFFEDFVDLDTFKSLGSRALNVDQAPRLTGSPGILTLVLTEPVTLVKGFRQVTVKASPRKPRRVLSTIQILCGKTK